MSAKNLRPKEFKEPLHTSIRRLGNDSKSLLAAARTVSIAFDQDPMVLWLRRGAPTWGLLQPQSMKWQCRRLARAKVDGIIVYVSTGDAPRPTTRGTAATTKFIDEDYGFAGLAILHPPNGRRERRWWNLNRLLTVMKLRLQDWFDTAPDLGSIPTRVATMVAIHNSNMIKQSSILQGKNIWYLEVCCTRTSAQGLGIGRQLMQWVVKQTDGDVCLLECTHEKNLNFYRRFGFEVAEVIELRDGDDVTYTWLMVKR